MVTPFCIEPLSIRQIQYGSQGGFRCADAHGDLHQIILWPEAYPQQAGLDTTAFRRPRSDALVPQYQHADEVRV